MVMRYREDYKKKEKDSKESKKKLDKILKVALTLDVKPEEELNQHILEEWKENISMKKGGKRRIVVAVVAACMVLATGSVLAAAKYMQMTELAERSGIDTMKNVFSGEDVTEINETKEAGEYRFTLLGIASGEAWVESSLSEQLSDLQGTYAAVAIERLDGTAMPDTSEDEYGMLSFFISPLIAGLKPWQYNIASMNGGYTDLVEDGILYRLISCDDVIPFADRELYLCISDTTFYDTNAYQYDENSGKISRKEEYSGINLLFSLPVDNSKADPVAAERYLKELEESWGSDSKDESEAMQKAAEVVAELERLFAEGQDVKALEGFVAVGAPVLIEAEGEGEYHYEYLSGDEMEVMYFYQENFQNGRNYMISYTDYNEETKAWEKISVVVLTENEDGTATAQRYEMEIS